MASRQAALWMGTARWEARRQQLFNAEPLCRMCAWYGYARAATVADHCVRHCDDAVAFWYGELQPLCSTCHDGPKQVADQCGYYAILHDGGWVVRIGLAGGFPRIGDDLDARAAAFEAGGVVENSGTSRSPTGRALSAELVSEKQGRAVRG